MEFTRINNDVNGNPRYVVHFLNLNTREELDRTGDEWISTTAKYHLAIERSHKIGGRKYHCRAYGGGIVFQSYSLDELRKSIQDVTGRTDQF